MAKDVVLPLLGLTMTEGTLISWLKQEGDPIKKGEVLFEVESDKAIQEVEAQLSGFLAKILVEPGTTLPIGTSIGIIAESEAELRAIQEGRVNLDEVLSDSTSIAAPVEEEPEPNAAQIESVQPSPASAKRRTPPVSPAAKRVAQEHNIDLATITGTGPGGRIMQEDVQQAVEAALSSPAKQQKVPVSPAAKRLAQEHNIDLATVTGSGPGGRIRQQDILHTVETSRGVEPDYLELTTIRRLTARRMSQSFQNVPHFYLSSELHAGALVTFRQERLADIEAETGVRITYTDLLVKSLGQTLKNHPLLYAMWEKEKIRLNQDINISIATDTEQGLTVPIIHGADRLSLGEIAQRRYELVQKAQANRLSLDDLSNGTFTLTNLGMFDVDVPQAIINPPQSAILATGSIKERPVARQGGLYVRPTMHVTLSIDHRVADGVAAAKFLQDFRRLIEDPERLAAEVK